MIRVPFFTIRDDPRPVAAELIPLRSARILLPVGEERVMISTLFSGLIAAAAAVAALSPTQQTYSFSSNAIGQVVFAYSISTIVVRTERKCHSRMVPIDPSLDARIRVPIPEDTKANSKIRVIPLPCK
jgi:hypothetical protein